MRGWGGSPNLNEEREVDLWQPWRDLKNSDKLKEELASVEVSGKAYRTEGEGGVCFSNPMEISGRNRWACTLSTSHTLVEEKREWFWRLSTGWDLPYLCLGLLQTRRRWCCDRFRAYPECFHLILPRKSFPHINYYSHCADLFKQLSTRVILFLKPVNQCHLEELEVVFH